jgi:hypothetical protein
VKHEFGNNLASLSRDPDPEAIKKALLDDPVGFMFAIWDAETAEDAEDADAHDAGADCPSGKPPTAKREVPPPPPAKREALQRTAKQPRRHCCPSCPCHISFAVGDHVRTNLFLPSATGTVRRLGKRMPRHDTGCYVYVEFDAASRSRLPPRLADRRHAFHGGFDLVPEGDVDPYAPKEKAPPSPAKLRSSAPSAHDGAIAA